MLLGKCEAFEIEFEIPGLPKMTNGLRVHWRVIQKERAKWKELVGPAAHIALNEQKRAARISLPLLRAQLTFTRYSSRQPDFDGLVSSFKGPQDSLVEVGILKDDSMSVVGQPHYQWIYAAPRKGKIKIKIESVEE